MVCKRIRKFGRRVSLLLPVLPSRSADSISRLINSPQFNLFRANFQETRKPRRRHDGFVQGQHVLAFYSPDREWFPATIFSNGPRRNGMYEIRWDDASEYELLKPTSQLKSLISPPSGTSVQVLSTIYSPCPQLSDMLLCLRKVRIPPRKGAGRKFRQSRGCGRLGDPARLTPRQRNLGQSREDLGGMVFHTAIEVPSAQGRMRLLRSSSSTRHSTSSSRHREEIEHLMPAQLLIGTFQ
jgi:hypothetical protein